MDYCIGTCFADDSLISTGLECTAVALGCASKQLSLCYLRHGRHNVMYKQLLLYMLCIAWLCQAFKWQDRYKLQDNGTHPCDLHVLEGSVLHVYYIIPYGVTTLEFVHYLPCSALTESSSIMCSVESIRCAWQ